MCTTVVDCMTLWLQLLEEVCLLGSDTHYTCWKIPLNGWSISSTRFLVTIFTFHISNSSMHVLFTLSFHLTTGFPLLLWPRTLIFTRKLFLHKLFTLLSFHMTKPPQSIVVHSFCYTTLHSICKRSYVTFF